MITVNKKVVLVTVGKGSSVGGLTAEREYHARRIE
jgi:hypothetical protein